MNVLVWREDATRQDLGGEMCGVMIQEMKEKPTLMETSPPICIVASNLGGERSVAGERGEYGDDMSCFDGQSFELRI